MNARKQATKTLEQHHLNRAHHVRLISQTVWYLKVLLKQKKLNTDKPIHLCHLVGHHNNLLYLRLAIINLRLHLHQCILILHNHHPVLFDEIIQRRLQPSHRTIDLQVSRHDPPHISNHNSNNYLHNLIIISNNITITKVTIKILDIHLNINDLTLCHHIEQINSKRVPE